MVGRFRRWLSRGDDDPEAEPEPEVSISQTVQVNVAVNISHGTEPTVEAEVGPYQGASQSTPYPASNEAAGRSCGQETADFSVATGRPASPPPARSHRSSDIAGLGVEGSGAPIRHYVVWKHPAGPELTGVHTGAHPACWNGLVALLPGGSRAGFRHRRAHTLVEAQDIFVREAGRHGCSVPPRIHHW